MGFSEFLADPLEPDPDSITSGQVGPGLARSYQTGLKVPVKKSTRIPVRDKFVSKSSSKSSCLWIFVSASTILTLYLDLPCLLASGVFVDYLPGYDILFYSDLQFP